MRWLRPTEREFDAGSGVRVILGDRSCSIPVATSMAMSDAVRSLCAKQPGIRVFAFAGDIEEVDGKRNRDLFHSCPPLGHGTDICLAFSRIKHLRPSKTILFSDGGCMNKSATLKVVEDMTGSIDCYFCEPPKDLCRIYAKDVDEGFMQKIARKGRGRYSRFVANPQYIEQLLEQSLQSNPPMSDRYRVRPDSYNVNVPGAEHRQVIKDVHLYHQTRYHHHYVDAEHIEHGAPTHTEIDVEATQGRVTIGEFVKRVWLGANYKPQEVDRGAITAAPPQQALAAPQRAIAHEPALPVVVTAAQSFAKRK